MKSLTEKERQVLSEVFGGGDDGGITDEEMQDLALAGKTPDELFKEKQASMSDNELIDLARKQVSELARTGGRSHRMCVPPMITDTDMLFSELIRRFELRNKVIKDGLGDFHDWCVANVDLRHREETTEERIERYLGAVKEVKEIKE